MTHFYNDNYDIACVLYGIDQMLYFSYVSVCIVSLFYVCFIVSCLLICCNNNNTVIITITFLL